MATVTPVTVSSGRPLGVFKMKVFNVLSTDQRAEYEGLRTKNVDKSSGVKIEKIREFTKRTSVSEGQGADKVITQTEELFVIVEFWETAPKTKENGDGSDDIASAKSAIRGQ